MVVEGTKSLVFISLKQKNMLKSHGICLKMGYPNMQYFMIIIKHGIFGYTPQFQTHFYVATTKVISSNFRTSRDSIHNSRGNASQRATIAHHDVGFARAIGSDDGGELVKRTCGATKSWKKSTKFSLSTLAYIYYGVPCSFSGVSYFDYFEHSAGAPWLILKGVASVRIPPTSPVKDSFSIFQFSSFRIQFPSNWIDKSLIHLIQAPPSSFLSKLEKVVPNPSAETGRDDRGRTSVGNL